MVFADKQTTKPNNADGKSDFLNMWQCDMFHYMNSHHFLIARKWKTNYMFETWQMKRNTNIKTVRPMLKIWDENAISKPLIVGKCQ